MKQLNLFEGTKNSLKDSLELTAQSLNAYGQKYRDWVLAFSGGKDSTVTATVIDYLISTGRVKRPKNLHIIYADTRMELPPLQISAFSLMEVLEKKGWQTHVARAPIDKRFLVYILGRGVPPPNNTTLRWCTQQIKVNPMHEQLAEVRSHLGEDENLLMITGVRLGESAIRDGRIHISCSKNGAECGQGWFQNMVMPQTDILAPILHWRVCHVWEWLILGELQHGFPTGILAEAYGGGEGTEDLIEKAARTGCMGCPLASRDLAIDNLIAQEKWAYLSPLKRLRPLYREWRDFGNRLQKVGEKRKNGSYSKNPNRKGPLTLEARERGLEAILAIQSEINILAERLGMPKVDMLSEEEEARIRELIEAETFPNGWTGDEPNGAELTPQYFEDGSKQLLLWS